MRCIVTGGAGFIGSHLVDALVSRGNAVMVIDDLSAGRLDNLNHRAELLRADIGSPKAAKLIRSYRPDVVFHLAAQASVSRSLADPARDLQVNVAGTINLALACVDAGVGRFVFSSSAAVYGNPQALPITEEHPLAPLSPYGVSKLTAERYLSILRMQHNLDSVILRYANVYGPRQTADGEAGVVAIFASRALEGECLQVYGDGRQTRDFINVADVVQANLAAAEHGAAEPLNISTGKSVTINELHALVATAAGCRPEVKHLAERPGDIRDSALDSSRAKTTLGWTARISLAAGLHGLLHPSTDGEVLTG